MTLPYTATDPVIVQVRDTLVDMDTVISTGSASSLTPHLIFKAPAAAINPGTSTGSETLVASTTKYSRAYVYAKKQNATNHTVPTDNTGYVYIMLADNVKLAIPLAPASWIELPANSDLVDFRVAAATQGDGVMVLYTV